MIEMKKQKITKAKLEGEKSEKKESRLVVSESSDQKRERRESERNAMEQNTASIGYAKENLRSIKSSVRFPLDVTATICLSGCFSLIW